MCTAEMSINVVTGDRLLATSVTNITADGEKIVRHVTRDIGEADIFSRGSSRQLQWADIFKCIVAGIKEEKIRVRSCCLSDQIETASLEICPSHNLRTFLSFDCLYVATEIMLLYTLILLILLIVLLHYLSTFELCCS